VTLHKIDLNLFRVFEAIMRHRSVNGASYDLRLTPSAISHALTRLRQALEDDLFVQGATGMEPTARALQLAPGIRNGLNSLADAVGTRDFVPSQALRTFRLAATDYSASVVLPRVVALLAVDAPQIDLRVFPANRVDVIRHLDEGRVDFVIGWFDDLPDRLCRSTLLQEREAVVVRAGHPLTAGPLTKERLLDFPHVVVELTGGEDRSGGGFLDERGASRRVWIERLLMEMNHNDEDLIGRVAVSVPHYAAVPPLLQATDMVATLPRRVAQQACGSSPLVILDLPYEPLTVNLEMIWHQRAHADPGIRWFVDEVTRAMAEPVQG
jgi:DNA-binding transcriptional LysR family regulator